MEELDDPEAAIEYYKRAETACPAEDYFHIGYINLRKASLYQYAYADSIPIELYKKAQHNFNKAREWHYEALSLNSLGILYSQISDFRNALDVAQQGISVAKKINDLPMELEGYNVICDAFYGQNKYDDVVYTSKMLPVDFENHYINRGIFDIISISFSKIGLPDSASKYIKIAPAPKTAQDTISMMRALAELSLVNNDIKGYIKTNEIAVNMSDSLILKSQAEKIRESENKYNMAQKDIEHLKSQKRYTFIIALLFFIIITVASLLYFQRQKTHLAKVEQEEAIAQLSVLNNQLNEVTRAGNLHIHDLKKQVHNLQKALIEKDNTQQEKESDIQSQLLDYCNQLETAEKIATIQNKTRQCLDEILRLSFYSGRYNSDQIIDNDSILEMSSDFWVLLYEVVSLKHNDLFERLEENITLSENEKKLISLCAINIPSAIIRRILNYKNIQVVSNLKRKTAKKITKDSTKIDDIFT